MPRARAAARALLPFAAHGLARTVDAAVGVLLHSTLDLPSFVREALGLVDLSDALRAVLLWTAAGALCWLALGALRARHQRSLLADALEDEARGFDPLYLRAALTLLALASLALRPAYPFGFTLPVALTQDWGVAQDLAAAAALVAWRRPRLRLPAPGAVSMGFVAFVVYALLTPEPARLWQNHPGNEPKTLRMAVAAGHWLSLDTEPVSAAMESLPVRPAGESLRWALGTAARETGRLLRALLPGGAGVGADAIRATRVTRQVVRGKEGGVYTVLAPGPSLLLALPLRLDRALNLARGTPGRVAITVAVWNALAALLVAVLFLLLRDVTSRTGLAAALSGLFALLPPLVFYSFQFYPEMLGALAMAALLRWLLFVPRWRPRTCVAMGVVLALLPWLHQKFLPVWLVLTAMAVWLAVDRMVRLSALAALVVPQAVSAALVALYNFAITGSVRPDALYLAWGPRGISSARVGQGLLGLLLDARFGLLPYVPLLLLAFAGLALQGRAATRLRWALPAVLAYYATVASADNWSGAVCNLGRYAMPVVPVLAAAVALALARASSRRDVLWLALTLGAWSAVIVHALWMDPDAANDCAVLLAKAHIADGNAYVPNLFLRTWTEGAPGLFARIAVWVVLAAVLAVWIRRAVAGRAADRPFRALAATAAIVLAAALVLERWPSPRTGAVFGTALEVEPGTTLFVSGSADVEDGVAHARSGDVVLLVRAREPRAALRLAIEGEGVVRVPGLAPIDLRGRSVLADIPLDVLRSLKGRRGVEETLLRQTFRVEAPRAGGIRFRAP